MLEKALEQFQTLSLEQLILLSLLSSLLIVIVNIIFSVVSHKKYNIVKVIEWICLAVYVVFILQITLLCRENDSRYGVEMVPFMSFFSENTHYRLLMMAYMVLNVILFFPFGFFIKRIISSYGLRKAINYIVIIGCSFSLSMTIEMLQLITNRGYYEVEDLICNTLGGIIGAVVYEVIIRLYHILRQN